MGRPSRKELVELDLSQLRDVAAFKILALSAEYGPRENLNCICSPGFAGEMHQTATFRRVRYWLNLVTRNRQVLGSSPSLVMLDPLYTPPPRTVEPVSWTLFCGNPGGLGGTVRTLVLPILLYYCQGPLSDSQYLP